MIFLKDVEGQLFADLSLTIAFAVFVSLIVAVTVVPVASMLFLQDAPRRWPTCRRMAAHHRLRHDSDRYAAASGSYWIGGLILGLILGTWLFLPSLQYLPQVKRAAIDGFIQYPAGATIDFADKQIAQPMVDRLQPYMTGEKQPKLLNYYIQNYGPGAMGLGVRVPDDDDFPKLENIVRNEIIRTCRTPRPWHRWAACSADSTKAAASRSISSPTIRAMRAGRARGAARF